MKETLSHPTSHSAEGPLHEQPQFSKGLELPEVQSIETQVQVGPVSQLHQCLVPRRIQSDHLFADSSLHSGQPWSVFSTSCHPLTPSHRSGAK